MTRGRRLVGSRARILMHRTAPVFGAGMSDEEPRITVVTITAAVQLTDGRRRYTALEPRPVEWIEDVR